MPVIVPIIPFLRRRRRRVMPTTPAVALAVVAVQNFSFSGADGECEVVLNTTAADPLSDVGAADPAKWTARFGGTLYAGASIEVLAFNVLYVSFAGPVAQAGANVIGYSNAPSDISDALGRQLAAFADFPM